MKELHNSFVVKTKTLKIPLKLYLTFILFIALSFELIAQEKKDSVNKFINKDRNIRGLTEFEIKLDSQKIKMPIEYFLLKSKLSGLDTKYFQEHKLVYTELTDNYKFSPEELNSGLSDDRLIAIEKNKKQMMTILAGISKDRADVNWEKIQRILGISQEAAALIIAAFSLMRH